MNISDAQCGWRKFPSELGALFPLSAAFALLGVGAISAAMVIRCHPAGFASLAHLMFTTSTRGLCGVDRIGNRSSSAWLRHRQMEKKEKTGKNQRNQIGIIIYRGSRRRGRRALGPCTGTRIDDNQPQRQSSGFEFVLTASSATDLIQCGHAGNDTSPAGH